MVATYEQNILTSYDSITPVLETVSRRDDSLGRRVKRRLKKFNKADNIEDKQKAVEQSYDYIIDSDYASELVQEAASLKSILVKQQTQETAFHEVNELLHELLGPFPGEQNPALIRKQYGQTRWDRSQIKLHALLYSETWDYSDSSGMGVKIDTPRVESFKDTALEPLFAYLADNSSVILKPKLTFYYGFFIDAPKDSHIFGGILPELLGTLYLTLGAMLFAFPIGIVTAIFFTEYAGDNIAVNLLRTSVSTLAGVPSIVFGLFGLAFFINAIHLPKSVLAGSLTLSLLILPTIIRASEEAIRSVPQTYREAALALGAGKWRTIVTIILPAALPGILTGSVISMGRAAGETAPIIFTAAVSVGRALKPATALLQPTPALSWNLYNLCTEHEAVDEIRHVQFGMAATLILVVLILNSIAIFMRARISKKLKG
ncbi:MAG: phosphate ABC transporter permease PstA [Kiritimatiellae bacterium]|nr:phosphate ABC transporter permease PstA [Kiritimatiellia bacterium]